MTDWMDLLQAEYSKGGREAHLIDCAGIAELINTRAGHLAPGQVAFPSYANVEPGLAFEEFLEQANAEVEWIGERTMNAQEVGDFVVTDPGGEGLGAHIFTLVDTRPRTFLTGMVGRGIRPVDERAIRRVRGVYRVRRHTS